MKLFTLALAPAALLFVAPAQEGAQVGDVIEFTFQSEPAGRAGVASMADLRGKPVLIDFWGTA